MPQPIEWRLNYARRIARINFKSEGNVWRFIGLMNYRTLRYYAIYERLGGAGIVIKRCASNSALFLSEDDAVLAKMLLGGSMDLHRVKPEGEDDGRLS